MAVISFKCPNCDGELIFDPATQKYKCEYCSSSFSQKELDELQPAVGAETKETVEPQQEEHTDNQQLDENNMENQSEAKQTSESQDGNAAEEAVIYSCPSCGAQIVTDATTAATFCYYCHNPVVLGGRLEGKYLPNKVIPFKITKKQAEQRFLEYVGKKKFVPKAFFNKKQIECLSGVYFPYWLYDVQLQGAMNAEAKAVRVWVAGDEEFTETKNYQLVREGDVLLKNLPENALQKANSKLASGVMPYKFEDMEEFQMGYLSGFLAERRDIEQDTVQGKMQNEMRTQAEKMMRDTMKGYNSVRVLNSNFKALKEKWSYVLLPVWTVTYKGRNGKMYYYSMNGQTGNVCGELPIDYKKVTLVSVITALVVLVAALIGGYIL